MNARSGIKVRFDKAFEKQCYDLIKLLGINFGPRVIFKTILVHS